MKLLIVVFLSVFTQFSHFQCMSDHQRELLKKWHMECFEKTNVDPDMILKLKSGVWWLDDTLLKKWIHCILKKYDLMSNEGVFRLDNAMAMVPDRDKTVVEDVIDACLPTQPLDPYEIAWRFAKCYHTKAQNPKNKDRKLHYLNLFY